MYVGVIDFAFARHSKTVKILARKGICGLKTANAPLPVERNSHVGTGERMCLAKLPGCSMKKLLGRLVAHLTAPTLLMLHELSVFLPTNLSLVFSGMSTDKTERDVCSRVGR